MTTSTMRPSAGPAPATPSPTDTAGPRQIQVWDPLVRVFHWGVVAAFATAFLVEDDLLGVHTWAGYLVLGLVAVRLVWGFIGTRHARFSDFVRGPGAVLGYLRNLTNPAAPRHLGHNPAGGAMVILLLILLTATGLSGLATLGAEEMAGPLAGLLADASPGTGHWFEELHEVLANLTLGCIVLHVLGVLLSSLAHRENLVRAMFDGRKRAD